ncbi:MAG: rhodanese-like domain-containing protein [Flavobacteriales bacterium]
MMTACSESQPTAGTDAHVHSEEATRAIMEDVDAAQFQRLIAELDGALLLDVRTPEEWAEGHLAGAAHKDYWGDDDFDAAMNSIPRDRPVLVYCAGGGRSGLTAQELNKTGHLKVYNLEDGITGWQDAGLPVTTGPAVDF